MRDSKSQTVFRLHAQGCAAAFTFSRHIAIVAQGLFKIG
jgi:hypothetical protein